jgi:hypothetical protein
MFLSSFIGASGETFMAKAIIGGAVLAAVLALGATTHGAAADGYRKAVHHRRQFAREWAPREFWQWDHRPIWDDPWTVLRPTIWGSPEPYVVPADIWACKWHLPPAHPWRWHRRRCRAWH